jgi:hypothetical protein
VADEAAGITEAEIGIYPRSLVPTFRLSDALKVHDAIACDKIWELPLGHDRFDTRDPWSVSPANPLLGDSR